MTNERKRKKRINFQVRERIIPGSMLGILPYVAEFIAQVNSLPEFEERAFVPDSSNTFDNPDIEWNFPQLMENHELIKSAPRIEDLILARYGIEPLTEGCTSSLINPTPNQSRETSNMPLMQQVEDVISPNIPQFFFDPPTENPLEPIPSTQLPPIDVPKTPVNIIPPDAIDDYYSIDEDGILSINFPGVLGNDFNSSTDTLNAFLVSNPIHGRLTFGQDGSFTYSPDPDFNGQDSFEYIAANKNGSDIAKVIIDVKGVNDVPDANNDTYSVNEDSSIYVNIKSGVLANDTDPDGDTLTVQSIVSNVKNGVLNWKSDGSFDYTPKAGFNGVDSFVYKISDGKGGFDTATATINIIPVNDPPHAVDDEYSINEDKDLIISLPKNGVLSNDTDPDSDILTASLISNTKNGVLNFNSDGTFTYTPNANYYGTDSFVYKISDGNGGFDSATVTITVNSINDPPDAVNDFVSTKEDSNIIFNVIDGSAGGLDTDIDGDSLKIDSFTQASNGLITLIDPAKGIFEYNPNLNFTGYDSFTYTISDGNGGFATATVFIGVNGSNDPPIANDDAFSTNEDTALNKTFADLLSNDTDPDFDRLSVISIGTIATSQGGIVTFDSSNKTWTYNPKANFFGTDTFTYQITDGNGGFDTATVSITVNPINDPPIANNDAYSTNEDTKLIVSLSKNGVLANDTDIDGGTLVIDSIIDNVDNGVLTLSPDGTFTYNPKADFFGTDSFVYKVSDGNGGFDTATVIITVNPINDPPIAIDDKYTINEDTKLTISLPNNGVLANDTDIDGDTLNATIKSTTKNGDLTLNPDGTFTYNPNKNFFGTDTFDYKVDDSKGGFNFATVTITVLPVNDPPIANNDFTTTLENTPLIIKAATLLSNDTDPDFDPLTITSVTYTGGNGGNVSITGTEILYTPAKYFIGFDSFTYTITDGKGGIASATVIVNVTPDLENDPPSAIDDNSETYINTPVIIDFSTILSNDSDPNGDQISIISLDKLSTNGGSISVIDNQITFNPTKDFIGIDTFTYKISDGKGGEDTATVSIKVLPKVIADNPIDSLTMDAVDNSKHFDSIDPAPTNRILQGSANQFMTAGVKNPDNMMLSYTFFIDKNNDGDFDDNNEQIGFLETSSNDVFVQYNPSSLTLGSYSAKVRVSDGNGFSEVYDTIKVVPWILDGIDSFDDSNYYNGFDPNPNNVLAQGIRSHFGSAGIQNPTGINLTYSFELNGEKTDLVSPYRSTIPNAFTIDTRNLSAGNYTLKLSVSDGIETDYATSVFTIEPWVIESYDAVSQSAINTIAVNDYYGFTMEGKIINNGAQYLTSNFYIDTNKDGIFQESEIVPNGKGVPTGYGAKIATSSASLKLDKGIYLTKWEVTDGNTTREAYDSLNVKEWAIQSFDALYQNWGSTTKSDEFVNNEISLTRFVANNPFFPYNSAPSSALIYSDTKIIGNTSGFSYEYGIDYNQDGKFENVDLNNDGDFNDLSEREIITKDNYYFPLNHALLNYAFNKPGIYDIRLTVTDPLGNSQYAFDTITVQNGWELLGVDANRVNSDPFWLKDGENSISPAKNHYGYGFVPVLNPIYGIKSDGPQELIVEYYIDFNKDGIFEENVYDRVTGIGERLYKYDPQINAGLSTNKLPIAYLNENTEYGTYNLKIKVTDTFGHYQEAYDTFTIKPNWSIEKFDAVTSGTDINGILQKVIPSEKIDGYASFNYRIPIADNNPNNIVSRLNGDTRSVLFLNNPNQIDLRSKVYIDFDKSGTFDDDEYYSRWNINLDQKDNTFNYSYNYWGFSQYYEDHTYTFFRSHFQNALPGDYNVKVYVTDGKTSQEAYDVLTLFPHYDVIDTDLVLKQGHATESGNLGVRNDQNSAYLDNEFSFIERESSKYNIAFNVNANNYNNKVLNYELQIDLNKNGSFDDPGDFTNKVKGPSYSNAFDSNYIYFNVDSSKILEGNYNYRVIVTDEAGNNPQITYDSFEARNLNWNISSYGNLWNNGNYSVANNIIAAPGIYKTNININTGGSYYSHAYTYNHYIDLNKNNIFEDFEKFSSTKGDRGQGIFNTTTLGLTSGLYNMKVDVSDGYGNTQSAYSSFEFAGSTLPNGSWSLKSLDADKNTSNNKIEMESQMQMTSTFNIENNTNRLLYYKFTADTNGDNVIDSKDQTISFTSALNGDLEYSFDISRINKPGEYIVQLEVSEDGNSYTSKLTDTFEVSDSQIKEKSAKWNPIRMDAMYSQNPFHTGLDANTNNEVVFRSSQEIILTASVDNPDGIGLSYQFWVDIDNSAAQNWVKAGGIQGSASGGDYEIVKTPYVATGFMPFGLNVGVYETKVDIFDNYGKTETLYDSFKVIYNSGFSITGIDAIDSDGRFGGADSNSENKINFQEKQNQTSSIGVYNPDNQKLNYFFFVDKNNNAIADKDEIQLFGSSTSSNISFNYSTYDFQIGEYKTYIIVTDQAGNSFNKYDSFTIQGYDWSIINYDSHDPNGLSNGDFNTENILIKGSPTDQFMKMTVLVDNSNKVGLNYNFLYISEEEFLNNGQWIEAASSSSVSDSGVSVNFNVSQLKVGNYLSKVVINSLQGDSKESGISYFSIQNPPINFTNNDGFDSIDMDGIYSEGDLNNDSHPTNRIYQGTSSINMIASVENSTGSSLNYQFFIKKDHQADSEYKLLTSQRSTSKIGISRNLGNINLYDAGIYNTKLVIQDSSGNIYEKFDQFEIIKPEINDFNIATGTSINTIPQGTNQVEAEILVKNPGKALLNYKVLIDDDNDGVFRTLALTNSAESDTVKFIYDASTIKTGTYLTKLTVTDNNGNIISDSYSSFLKVTQPWTLDGFDAVNDNGIFGLPDSSPTNIVYQGEANMKMVVGVTNPLKAIINYQFQIDSYNDNVFENIGPKQASTDDIAFAYEYDASALKPGTYNARVLVSDSNGISYKIDDKFSVVAPNFLGFDAVDQDGIYSSIDVTDSHIDNKVAQGSPSIKLVSGVDNKGGLPLIYNYEIDLTDDGVINFVSIGSTTSNNINGGFLEYNVYTIEPGNYAARVTVSDLNNNVLGSQTDNFSIVPSFWTLNGLDPIDLDGIYSPDIDLQDTHIGNQIVEGYREINLVAGVTNDSGIVLNYEFRIDLNNNGSYNDSGELIGNVSSFHKTSASIKYDTYSLKLGTYKVEVKVTDVTGKSYTKEEEFTIIENNWSIEGFDSVDSDRTYGSPDTNTNNEIALGIKKIDLTAGIKNSGQGELTYQFQIDTNGDGVFENIGSKISSSNPNNVSIQYDVSKLLPNTYNTRLIVTDVNNKSLIQDDSFAILRPLISEFDILRDSVDNSFLEGSVKTATLSANISNLGKAELIHKLYIDLNNDDLFTADELFSDPKAKGTSSEGEIEIQFNPESIKSGTYSAKLSTEFQGKEVAFKLDSIKINDSPWDLKGFDAFDSDFNYGNLIDNNPFNIISMGSSIVPISIDIDNVNARELTYKFQIDLGNNVFEYIPFHVDLNNNGIFDWKDSINLFKYSSNSESSPNFFLDLSKFSAGEYNIKLTVSDSVNLEKSFESRVNIISPIVIGLDSIDENSSYGGVDSNPTNTVLKGNKEIILNAGVINPGKAELIYDFYVDKNNDNIFDKSELIYTVKSDSSSGAQGKFDPYSLDINTYKTQVLVSDINGLAIGEAYDSFKIESLNKSWTLTSLDSVLYNKDNTLSENANANLAKFNLKAFVDNTYKTGLTYDFYIDETPNDGIENFKLIKTIETSNNVSGETIEYNYAKLLEGTYKTKIVVTDVDGYSQEKFDKFTIVPIDPSGFAIDSIHGDSDNKILQGTSRINTRVSLNNPALRNMLYTHSLLMDKDGDGSFETTIIENGTIQSNSSVGIYIPYDTYELGFGKYQTLVEVKDTIDGSTHILKDEFEIEKLIWSAKGLDSIDNDGIFGGPDSNVNNTIQLGTTGITLVAGVSNTNATLKYQFYVDINNDGDFNDTGELIKTLTNSTSDSGVSTSFNPFNLSAGTYNTKVVITDQVGQFFEKNDSFTVINPNGLKLDTVDGGANVITQGTASITMRASINNIGEAGLTYTFLIDRNHDGDFDDLTDFIGSAASNSATGISRIFDTSTLFAGTYNLKVLVYDLSGLLIAQDDDVLLVNP